MGKGGGKLFTPEDPVHSHKLLGMYALIHFAYRYAVFFFRGRADMGFAATSPLTPWLLLPHALLQVPARPPPLAARRFITTRGNL